MTGFPTFVVTDIEADGLSPERNSMLAFAAVAVSASGDVLDEFEAVLAPRPDRAPNPDTMRWWQGFPEAWAAATTDPQPPGLVMARFCNWVEGLPAPRIFAARPLAFDGPWIDHYLQVFADTRIFAAPYLRRTVFQSVAALDIDSFVAGVQRQPGIGVAKPPLPSAAPDTAGHTHRAIDDARGYGRLLQAALRAVQPSGPS